MTDVTKSRRAGGAFCNLQEWYEER